jgi:hypothetical protein
MKRVSAEAMEELFGPEPAEDPHIVKCLLAEH